MSRNLRAVPLLLSLALLGPSCGRTPPPPKKAIRPVRVLQVSAGISDRQRTFSGTAKAGTESALSFKVTGQISKLLAKVGDRVKKEQLIATLDDKDYRLQLKQAQAAHAQTRAQARQAESSYQRTRRLYENRSVSVKDLENARAAAESARAQVAAQAQAVALARSRIDYCKLRAPATGEIAKVPASVNENVSPGQPIAVVISGSVPEVAFTVPESMIGAIKKGAPATVTFAALKDFSAAAHVTEVSVSASGTAYPVTVRLDKPAPAVRAGMVAEVRLDIQRAQQAGAPQIFVPASAVLEDDRGRFSFVAVGQPGRQGRVERRPVKTGELTPAGLVITDGLKPGDLLITAGVRFVEPKMTVRIVRSAP